MKPRRIYPLIVTAPQLLLLGRKMCNFDESAFNPGWYVRGTIGKGAFATVSAAKHTVTGVAGAAKFFVRTQESHPTIAMEIQLLKSLPVHVRLRLFTT
jgi:hypothetical protein